MPRSNWWERKAATEFGFDAGDNGWVDPSNIDLVGGANSGGGNAWRDTPAPIRAATPAPVTHPGGEPTVQIPQNPRRVTGIEPATPSNDTEWVYHPGGERRFLPSPSSAGGPIVQTPRAPAGSGLGRLANVPISGRAVTNMPISGGRGGVTTPVGNRGEVLYEYRPGMNSPANNIAVDPLTGRPFDLNNIPEASAGGIGASTPAPEVRRGELVDETTGGGGGETEAGGFTRGERSTYVGPETVFNYGSGRREPIYDPNTPDNARAGLNARIAMATAPGAPNFGGARRPQSDEGVNVNAPLQSGYNLERDEGGGFVRRALSRGTRNPQMRAWAELLSTAQGREQAAAMTRAQQQAYAGVEG